MKNILILILIIVVYQHQSYNATDLYDENAPVVAIVMTDTGVGAGSFLNDSVVLTAHHVVARASKIKVRAFDGRTVEAKVVFNSKERDFALLKLKKPIQLERYIEFSTTECHIGDNVYVIGHPYNLQYSLSSGVISAFNRKFIYTNEYGAIQVDAPINGGNSGGPVFNDRGKAIGIVSYRARGGDGLGFLVPIDAIFKVINDVSGGIK